MGESVYQTIQINNTSDTPAFYKLIQDPTKVFRAYPSVGLIPGKSFGLVCFEFQPKKSQFWNFTTQIVFNHTSSTVKNIHLLGLCFEPKLVIGNDQKMFFAPTFSGVSTKQKLAIMNSSQIPVEWECNVPEKYRAAINFEPIKSVLRPNEETKVYCTFTPLKKKEYIIKIPLYVSTIYD